jgi:hypothetical protein
MSYYDMALNKEEQTAYEYATEHSDMEGPCCCKCWRWKVYGGGRSAGMCMGMMGAGACQLVQGRISPMGWCDLYAPA